MNLTHSDAESTNTKPHLRPHYKYEIDTSGNNAHAFLFDQVASILRGTNIPLAMTMALWALLRI